MLSEQIKTLGADAAACDVGAAETAATAVERSASSFMAWGEIVQSEQGAEESPYAPLHLYTPLSIGQKGLLDSISYATL